MIEIFGMTRYVNLVYAQLAGNALASQTAQHESKVDVGTIPMMNTKRPTISRKVAIRG
jgi:hypothetical protein